MSRHSSASSTVPKAPRAEGSWWLQGSFCSHVRLLNPSQLHIDAESNIGAGDQLLAIR